MRPAVAAIGWLAVGELACGGMDVIVRVDPEGGDVVGNDHVALQKAATNLRLPPAGGPATLPASNDSR